MTLSRIWKRWIILATIGTLFFAQMAMAAYVCPMQSGATTGPQALASVKVAAMADMPNCVNMDTASMDADAPGLCHASCTTAGQSDRTPALKLPVATLESLPFVVLPAAPLGLVDCVVSLTPPQAVGASPPLSVLYCCLRI